MLSIVEVRFQFSVAENSERVFRCIKDSSCYDDTWSQLTVNIYSRPTTLGSADTCSLHTLAASRELICSVELQTIA
jgi:hypothetical protein